MAKGQKKDKSSFSEKKAAFWRAILAQKIIPLRNALSLTAMEAQTRDDEGLTGIMYATINNKTKALDCLLDWYERRRELRRKGWVNLVDDNGRTALMMAAALGNIESMESLLRKNANATIKDSDGRTARDHAVMKKRAEAVEFLDDWFKETDDDEEIDDGGDGNDGSGLTSTQRSKLKKRQLLAEARKGIVQSTKIDEVEEDESEPESNEPGPPAFWPEVAKVVESVEMLRSICEITIERTKVERDLADSNGVDPALWFLRHINRLEMRLAPGILTRVPVEISQLRRLQTLILSGNSISLLPEEISQLKHLKVLEVAHNSLVELPASLNKCKKLETVDVSFNQLSDIKPLKGLKNLGALQVSGNKLTSLDLDCEDLGRLYELQASNNQLRELPAEIGKLSGLVHLAAEKNQITSLPAELTSLKKVKVLKLMENPIKDQKVVKMIREDQRKDLWKYLDKQRSRGKKESAQAKKSKSKFVDDKSENDDEDYETDDSFDISMAEL